MDERISTLIQKYLDEAISAVELVELEEALQRDPQAAEAFAEATRLHGSLMAMFQEEAAVRDATATLRRSLGLQSETSSDTKTDDTVTRRASEEELQTNAASLTRRATVRWLIATAAMLLIAVGVIYWTAFRNNDPPIAQQPHRVVEGEVFTNGHAADELFNGDSFRVSENKPAVIELADGSQAELEPSTQFKLHSGKNHTRQIVELVDGSGTFRVAKGDGRFQVKTSIGEVTVLGTEFFVHLLPDTGRNDPSNETGERQARPNLRGDEEMKKVALMAVVVLSGIVQVDIAGKTYTLTGGNGQAFAEEDDRRAPAVAGLVKAVDAEKGTITLAGREGRVVVPDKTYVVSGEAKTQLADVKAGNPVTLILSNDKESVVNVAVREPRRRGEGEREREGQRRGPGGPADMAARMVKEFDKDGDMKLDTSELTAMFTAMRERRAGAGQGNSPGPPGQGRPDAGEARPGDGDAGKQSSQGNKPENPGGVQPKRPDAE